MLKSSTRHNHTSHKLAMDSSEQIWPDDTIAVLPETPRVRMSPRRKMNPMSTPGWPSAHMGSTIRMYQDPEEEDETVNFTMNADFIESRPPFEYADGDMHSFIPPVSPTKLRMLSPSRREEDVPNSIADDVIEIPDSAGLSDMTRDAIFNVWANDDPADDEGFDEHVHYLRDCQSAQYKQRNAKLNLTIRYLVNQLQEKEKETQRILPLEKKLMHLQTQLKSLALVPMTPIRTSSLRHNMVQDTSTRTPRSAKENMHPRSRSASPRKPLKEVTNGIQPTDLIKEDTDEFIEHSKRMFRNIQIENNSLRNKVEELQEAKLEMEKAKLESVDQLQVELERLSQENHRLEKLLQDAQKETTQVIMSPRPTPKETHSDEEIARLKDELNWHAKLMSYAEKERMRLLDLLDFSGKEGKFVVKEYAGLREKMSKVSLKSEGSSCKCLI